MEAAGEAAAGIATAGQLRAAIAGVPDDTPVIVVTAPADGDEDGEEGEHVIAGAGRGFLDWSNMYRFVPSGGGPVGAAGQDVVLALRCREADLTELDRMVWHGHPRGRE
jgi:hypothetical protein